jgi:hypothetical protein
MRPRCMINPRCLYARFKVIKWLHVWLSWWVDKFCHGLLVLTYLLYIAIQDRVDFRLWFPALITVVLDGILLLMKVLAPKVNELSVILLHFAFQFLSVLVYLVALSVVQGPKPWYIGLFLTLQTGISLLPLLVWLFYIFSFGKVVPRTIDEQTALITSVERKSYYHLQQKGVTTSDIVNHYQIHCSALQDQFDRKVAQYVHPIKLELPLSEEFIQLHDLVDPNACGYPLSDPQIVYSILKTWLHPQDLISEVLNYLCVSVRNLWVYPCPIVYRGFAGNVQKIIVETDNDEAFVFVSSVTDEHWYERHKTLIAFLNRLQILDQNAGSIFLAYDYELESMETCSRLNRYMEEMLPEETKTKCTLCVL